MYDWSQSTSFKISDVQQKCAGAPTLGTTGLTDLDIVTVIQEENFKVRKEVNFLHWVCCMVKCTGERRLNDLILLDDAFELKANFFFR